MLKEFLATSTWAHIQDPKGLSGKKRKELGLDKLHDDATAVFLQQNSAKFSDLAWDKLKQAWPHFGEDTETESE